MFKHASGVDLALLRSDPVDHGLLEFMVAVSAEHVPLPVNRESACHIPHQFGCETLRRNRKPLSLSTHVRATRLCLKNDLRLKRIECLRKCSGSMVGLKFREEIHAAVDAGLIHGRQVVPVTNPYYAVPQCMNLLRLGAAM